MLGGKCQDISSQCETKRNLIQQNDNDVCVFRVVNALLTFRFPKGPRPLLKVKTLSSRLCLDFMLLTFNALLQLTSSGLELSYSVLVVQH